MNIEKMKVNEVKRQLNEVQKIIDNLKGCEVIAFDDWTNTLKIMIDLKVNKRFDKVRDYLISYYSVINSIDEQIEINADDHSCIDIVNIRYNDDVSLVYEG